MKLLQSLTAVLLLIPSALGQDLSPGTPQPSPVRAGKRATPQPFVTVAAMQEHFVARFQAAPGFGASRSALPDFLLPSPDLRWAGQNLPVHAPDLIGLEDHPEGVAYVAERGVINIATLSQKAARARLHQRKLTRFETEGVAALRSGRDLVVVGGPNAAAPTQPLLALGALRATANCCSCHGGTEGKLLGAFSYVLTVSPTNAPGALPADSPAGPPLARLH
jgi:hypothetical protein